MHYSFFLLKVERECAGRRNVYKMNFALLTTIVSFSERIFELGFEEQDLLCNCGAQDKICY